MKLPTIVPFASSPYHSRPAMVLQYAPFVRGLLVIEPAWAHPTAATWMLQALERSE